MKQGTRVRCVPSADETDTELTPPGRWWVVSPHPTTGHYWFAPDDETARTWAAGVGIKFLDRSGRHVAVGGVVGQ